MKVFKLFLLLSVTSVVLLACEIPVFRYALERWKADPYRLKIITSEKGMSDQEKSLVNDILSETWKGGGSANMVVETVPGEKSSFELSYPEKSGILRHVRKGSLDDLTGLLDSPARNEVQNLILKGRSIVWVIIQSGDENKDRAFESALEEKVAAALGKVKLSEAIIKKPEVQNQKKLSKEEVENILHSEIPLELSFATVKVDRTDKKERFFVDMLMRQSPGLEQNTMPIAFPVFGRGRVLEAVSNVDDETLETLTFYLSRNCSCTVKDENPGIDLLMNVPWQDYTANSTLQYRDILPPISGVIEKEEAARAKAEAIKKAKEEAAGNTCILREPQKEKKLSLTVILGIAVGVLVIIIFFAGTVINRSKSE